MWEFPLPNGDSDIVCFDVTSPVFLTFMKVSYVNVDYMFDENRYIINDMAKIIVEQKQMANK